MASGAAGEELRLRAAVESSPNGLLMVDASGTIQLVNREVERLFGYDRRELLGRKIEVLVPERYRQHHPDFRSGFARSPQARAMGVGRDLYGVRKDGSEFPVEIGLTPVSTAEGLFIISSVVDITTRKESEAEQHRLEEQLRQSQKLEAVGQLAGGIAHDFNNILGMIITFAELARDRQDAPVGMTADLDEILAAAGRGRDLVQRILRFSRRHHLSLRPLDIPAVVAEIAALLRSTLPANVTIQVRVDERIPPVMGDLISIHQVVMNLVTNAADAMPGGGPLQIELAPFYARDSFVRSHPELHEGHYVRLDVRDAGTGMDQATRERAFEPFFTTKAPGSGTGLGLAMVHGILRDHGGTVLLDSVPGEGTTVTCLLPAVAEHAFETQGQENAARATDTLGHGERVLLVDDEASLLRANARRLEGFGFVVTKFADPIQALQYLEVASDPGDVLVTDFSMHGLTGVELAAHAHRQWPTLPIILVTGYLEGFEPEELARIGIVRILTKPVSGQDFGAVLREVLDQQKG
jgi:PAS domain S-box-containing protein